MTKFSRLLSASCAIALVSTGVFADEGELGPLAPDGLAFSVENMNPSVDPATDFYRYAAGGWLERVQRPADKIQIGFMSFTTDRIDARVKTIFSEAIAASATAPKGSPKQLVGDMYKSFMDVDAINAAGLAPIQPELDRIAAIRDTSDLARYLGHFTLITGEWPMLELDVFEGLDDAKTNRVYVQPGQPAISVNAFRTGPPDSPAKKLYENYIVGLLTAADYKAAQTHDIAKTSIAIETAMHAGEMDPVLMVDYRNQNNPRTPAQLRAELSALPLDTYFASLGLPPQTGFTVNEPDYPAALNGILLDYSTDQLKDYMTFRLLRHFAAMLPTKFEAPGDALNEAFSGVHTETPREQNAVQLIKGVLAQPIGRLYVNKYFTDEAHKKGLDVIRRMQAAFRKRILANDWMAETTRKEALHKIDSFYYKFGIPDEWIDYSKLDIGDRLIPNMIEIARFNMGRKIASAGQPVKHWAFSNAGHTAPTVVNAGYNPSINGFEVTAGFGQPPAFEPDLDAPVYFCRFGGAVGHEMMHGFDTGGRNFDSDGNLRNWWTDTDAARFETESKKLIVQGNAYEALPDTYMNGGLSVKENMADVGGIMLAYDALTSYLAEHPEENIEIDGMTPAQRCFVAWAQLWAEQSTDQQIKVQLDDNHPPSPYRSLAPLQHLDAFYTAFDIKAGDPMWLPPEKRLRTW